MEYSYSELKLAILFIRANREFNIKKYITMRSRVLGMTFQESLHDIVESAVNWEIDKMNDFN